jgi:hypothetical protein
MEGDCYYRQCEYKRFELVYKEVNDGTAAITGGYTNAVLYDGDVLRTFYMPDALQPNSFQLRNVGFRFGNVVELQLPDIFYWGLVDEKNHTLEVVLDYGEGRANIHTGNVTLRYCGFDSVRCGCGVDVTPGAGVYMGNMFWPWDSGARTVRCLWPEQTTFREVTYATWTLNHTGANEFREWNAFELFFLER